MTRDQAASFAQTWIASWNAGDVEAVAGHYAQDCVFISPRAAALVGDPVVRGRAALLSYWQQGRARAERFDFRLLGWHWDAESPALTLRYVSSRSNSVPVRAVEIMRFGPDGKIVEGEALYGAEARIS